MTRAEFREWFWRNLRDDVMFVCGAITTYHWIHTRDELIRGLIGWLGTSVVIVLIRLWRSRP